MNIQEKKCKVDELSKLFGQYNCFYIIDSTGISANVISDLRKECFNNEINYLVTKNSFIKRAIQESNMESDKVTTIIDQVLHGVSGLMFINDNISKPAKILNKLKQEGIPFVFKCAYFDGELFVGENNLNTMKNMKSQKELVADIIALLQSPIKNIISALKQKVEKEVIA